jgi:hypothetical protein
MFSNVAAAATSVWNGPSGLAGATRNVTDAFEVPGNATVIDAWLHVDESGYLEDGSGITWSGEDVPGNFSSGQFSDTLIGKFDGAMSLAPDSAVSNIDTFTSASLQLPGSWSQVGTLWEAVNPSGLGGTVSGSTRTLAHGFVPANAADGGVVAGTLPGQALPSGSSGSLAAPQFSVPQPINDFNFTFSHWHHLDVNDGAWVEYKLDNGNWTYLEPAGGYPSTISTNASVPNGANGSGFGVFGDGNHSSWTTSIFNLDNLTGINNASQMQFRFQVWTDSNNTLRPGWFIDDFEITNVGNSVGVWHHGCYSQTTSNCFYNNNAQGAMESDINLSSSTSGAKILTRLEFDLEGSSYDNFCVELSNNNGTTWTDISSATSSTLTSCRSRTGAIPGSGYTLPNGTTVGDDSGGYVELEFAIPASMIGSTNSSKIRYVVQTDSSVQYGTPQDTKEGLSVSWFKVVNSGTAVYTNMLSTSSSATHYGISGSIDDWAFLQIGSGGISISYSLEDSSALPPGGWNTSNVAGQTGWEFGALCPTFTDGPSSFPSASLGFGTNLCGDYDSSSDNSLISPNYYVPLGASARFVWKHWMCSEDTYDGGALYYSVNGGAWTQAYVNYANGTNWYDGTITWSTHSGTDVWDGRQYVAASGSFSCTSSANIPWLDMAYDVSNLSGNNVSFKFRQVGDSAVNEPGWYVDNIGLEVDWFETEGSWTSPAISTHDLGNGFVDADIILPNNTWYGVNVLNAAGHVLSGHSNMSLPLSLASIDRDANPDIHIEIMLGTDDEYYTPLISELSVGATRYFGHANGWNIPSAVVMLSNGSWENTGGGTQVITGQSGYSARPISSATVTGNFTQTTASLITVGTQKVSTTTASSVLNLGDMRTYVSPTVSMAPGAMIESLAFRGAFAQPAHDASIDLADDGVIDWSFTSSPSYGSYGWQTRTYCPACPPTTSASHSMLVIGNDTLTVMVPEIANVHSLLLGVTPNGETAPLTLSSGGNSFYQLSAYNWTTSVISISNPQLSASSTHVDPSGRNWSVFDIQLNSSPSTTFKIGSFAIGYNLLENVSGLGQVVKTYHEVNSNNGLETIVDIPLTWNSVAGGVAIDGGVYHENMITNHPFSVPDTWYPNNLLQGFSTQHHHLLGNENIDEIHLIGLDSSGDSVNIVLSDIQSGGTFTQASGFGMLKLSNTTSVSEIAGRIVVDWQFEVDWDWDDSQSISWSAQGYDENGEGLSPATAQSGGVATQASENDLQVDSWQVSDLYGHDLSDMFSPAYPFWAKSGSQVSVSGTVRFENTLDMRPIQDDFVVAVDIDGVDVILNSTSDGQWTGLVTLPSNVSQANLTPYVFRAGPITGASGAEDATLTTPVNILLDGDSPWASNLQINNGQRLLAADGFTWDPSSSLSLQVTVTDDQALGDKLTMHYWREVMDDSNGDGLADESEYQTMFENLPEGISGERTLTFSGIDVSGLEMNALFSVYFTGTDYAGHQLMYGGDSGVDNDMATLIIAVNEPTDIPTTSLSLNTVNEQLLAGQMHTLSMNIDDANGVNSVDLVTVKLLGADVDDVGVMNWEPRNGAMYSGESSQLTLHDVRVTEQGDYSLVEWDFTLDWDFDESLITEYALPGIVVFDDDDLNPVVLMTNLGIIRWQLDNNLQVNVGDMGDNTPPISASSAEHIYVQPGDDLTFSGTVVFEKSGAQLSTLPGQGLEIAVSTVYGSESIQSYAEVGENGTWETGLILPSRSLIENILVVDYHITGVQAPGEDSSVAQTLITVDETAPVVQFSSVPLSLDDYDLEVLQFAIQITENGGMPEGDLLVNWAFLRNSVIMNDGQSSSALPFISNNSGSWSYVGSMDFTEGVNVSLEEGDELIWWIDVVDRAGNTATGTGLSLIDAMNTDFTVLSYDVTVTNIEISLADGKAPRGNEVVEGTELGIIVHVRNLGTKTGTVTISLMEDMGESRSWLSHGDFELSLSPGQTLQTIPILYETHGAGQQNLYVNVTGMDSWVDNSLLPHCYPVNGNASCSLNVESDMPRVISQDDAESGLDGFSAFNIILVLLLIGAAITIVVLTRKSADESIFYDDDEWEEDVDDIPMQKVTPILPPMAPVKPDLDAATKSLEVVETRQSEDVPETKPEIAEDPWGDIDHSEDEVAVEEEVVAEETIAEEVVVEETTTADETTEETTVEESDTDEGEDSDYSSMTVKQLKEILRERGLPISGKKSALVARLEE